MNYLLKDMLLIEDPSIIRLYREMVSFSNYFIAPIFTIALVLEYFSEMNFGEVVKKLLLVVVFMSTFYSFHIQGTNIALESAERTLRRVSPSNLFVKKWTQHKVKTKKQKGWNAFKSLIIPNLNDLLGTAFFLLAKIFIWLLKLIYSSVYHLTYIFAGVTAILYFLGWTKDALKGTVQASLWCMLMPFVIVAILALVGNSIEDSALNGDLVIANIDTIIWLFGITLLLLISPLITYGMIRGDGIHSFGSRMGSMVVSTGIKAMAFYPLMAKMMSFTKNKALAPMLQTRKGNFEFPKRDAAKNNRHRSEPSKKVESQVNYSRGSSVGSAKTNSAKSLHIDHKNMSAFNKSNDAKSISSKNDLVKNSIKSEPVKCQQIPNIGMKKYERVNPSQVIIKTHTVQASKQTKTTELQKSAPQKLKPAAKGKNKNGLR